MKTVSKIFNLLLVLLVVIVAIVRVPEIYKQYTAQGNAAPVFSVLLSAGKTFHLTDLDSKKIIVFWATWCPPCEIELARINNMIKENKLDPEMVLAISVSESKSLVDQTIKDRGYLFNVGYDPDAAVSNVFKVAGTPTIIFLNEDKTINWMTTGLSPLLGLRIQYFTKNFSFNIF